MIITTTTYYDPVDQKRIEEACPGCGESNCLELQFFQKRIETGFSKKVTNKVTGILFCHHTNTEIPPVQWSDSIEKKFLAQKQQLVLQPPSFKLSKWFYFLTIVPFLIIAGSIYYYFQQDMQYRAEAAQIEQVKPGNKVFSMFSYMKNNQLTKNGYTWFLVKEIKGDTIFLQRHKNFVTEKGVDFDLAPTEFTGENIAASLRYFRKKSIEGFDMTKPVFTGYITEIKQ
jgi:hypothetical protein